MLNDNLDQYSKIHPEVPFHEVIDIIRPKADQDFLDAIIAAGRDESSHSGSWGSDFGEGKDKVVEFIYLDRNNTPDVWMDISESIKKGCCGNSDLHFQSILILPE
jgi:hypothetical protein